MATMQPNEIPTSEIRGSLKRFLSRGSNAKASPHCRRMTMGHRTTLGMCQWRWKAATKPFLVGTVICHSIHTGAFQLVKHSQRPRSICRRTTATMNDDSGDIIIHLNHAGASPSPPSVLEKVVQHMELEQRWGGYAAAGEKENELRQVYEDVARLVHASSDEIALLESATVAWTRVFYAMVNYQDKKLPAKKKVILISDAEYASNVVAACQLARTHEGWTVLAIPSCNTKPGVTDVQAFRDMLSGSLAALDPTTIALVCVTHVPTNSGIVNPVYEIGAAIAEYNDLRSQQEILYLVDACQSVGQLEVNAKEMQCHGLTATGRKYLRGPRGTGFLYVHQDVCQHLIPSHVDHTCAPVTAVPQECPPTAFGLEDWLEYSFREGASRVEFWESNFANKLGLGEAVRFAMDEVGIQHISNRCQELATELYHRLRAMDGIHVHHESECGIVTFSVRGVDSSTVKQFMWNKQQDDDACRFEVSVVPATFTPLDSARYRVPDLIRASMTYTNSLEDIDAFCKRLAHIKIYQ